MKKILICLSSFTRGNGIAKFIMNFYPYLIEKNYSIDFLLCKEGISDLEYLKVIEKNNGKVYYINSSSALTRISDTKKRMHEILSNNQYDVVHVNLVDMYAYGCIKGAYDFQIEKIIYHIHNPYTIGKLLFIRNILNKICIRLSTDLVACTEYAGKSMFNKNNFIVCKNAMYLEEYKFIKSKRDFYRKKWGIEGKFVIGAVGRADIQKNPLFALRTFLEIKKVQKNAFFIWVGVGKKRKDMEKFINKNRLNDCVLLLENRTDINYIYSAFDIFLLPSKFEGLGIVFLEAQCNGLPIFTSTHVPLEISKTSLVKFLDLKQGPKTWSEVIMESPVRSESREDYFNKLLGTDYDIKVNQNLVCDIYQNREKTKC